MAENQEYEAVLAIEDDQNTGMERNKTTVGNSGIQSKFMVKLSKLKTDASRKCYLITVFFPFADIAPNLRIMIWSRL